MLALITLVDSAPRKKLPMPPDPKESSVTPKLVGQLCAGLASAKRLKCSRFPAERLLVFAPRTVICVVEAAM